MSVSIIVIWKQTPFQRENVVINALKCLNLSKIVALFLCVFSPDECQKGTSAVTENMKYIQCGLIWNAGSLSSIRISFYGHVWSLDVKADQVVNHYNKSINGAQLWSTYTIQYTRVSSSYYHSMTIKWLKYRYCTLLSTCSVYSFYSMKYVYTYLAFEMGFRLIPLDKAPLVLTSLRLYNEISSVSHKDHVR